MAKYNGPSNIDNAPPATATMEWPARRTAGSALPDCIIYLSDNAHAAATANREDINKINSIRPGTWPEASQWPQAATYKKDGSWVDEKPNFTEPRPITDR